MLIFRSFKLFIFLVLLLASSARAQFLDNFDEDKIDGWFFFTGDGNATMDFVQKKDYAQIIVDGSQDKYNVWWSLIKRDITRYVDMSKFKKPDYELRVEARVRVSHAPCRLNFMINTQRTTDFHKDLMEFDIPDTSNWHVISMTTRDLDVLPGDTLYVQLCATDMGFEKYHVDVDYYKADIINVKKAGPDKGALTPYHPAIPALNSFSEHLSVSDDVPINRDFPDVNFNDWATIDADGKAQVLTVNGSQWVILKWNFEQYQNSEVDTSGVLELTTQSLALGGNYDAYFGHDLGMEFGKIRVVEILGADSNWEQESVSYNSFLTGHKLYDVINSQMVYDAEVATKPGEKTLITINKPVMRRLLSGRTRGLIIQPLGAISATFYASEDASGNGPKLHFSLSK